MSIPASVILGGDLDTLGRLRSGRLDYPWFPTKERPFAEGQMLEIPAKIEDFTLEYIVPHDFELYSIALACSEYAAEDCWSVYMGEDEPQNYILKDIYTKDLPEGFQLMAVMTFFKDDKLTLKFTNRSGRPKFVWINYQGLVDGVGQSDPKYRQSELSTEGLHISENHFGALNKGTQLPNGLFSESTPLYAPDGSDENFIYGEGRITGIKDALPSDISIDSMAISEGYRADFYSSPSTSGEVLFTINPKKLYYVIVNSTGESAIEAEKNFILQNYYKNIEESELGETYPTENVIFITKTLLDKARSVKITKL